MKIVSLVFIGSGILKRVDMVAYEFYWRDETGDAHLVGILPERRKNSNRITNESIMKWVKKVIGNGLKADDIFFSKVNINEF
jgi:hypothetical protein